MRNLKTRKTLNIPLMEAIKDSAVVDFLQKLLNEMRQTQLNIYDDLNAMVKIEKVTALPTADAALRGKMFLLDNGAAADTLHICRDSAVDGTYEWKTVTLA